MWYIIIVWWSILLIGCISNFKVGIVASTLFMVLFECINYFKVILRQENFVPWDIKIAKEALSVINMSDLPWCGWLLLLVGLVTMVIVFIYPFKLGKFAKVSLKIRLVFLGVLFSLGIYGGGRKYYIKHIFYTPVRHSGELQKQWHAYQFFVFLPKCRC